MLASGTTDKRQSNVFGLRELLFGTTFMKKLFFKKYSMQNIITNSTRYSFEVCLLDRQRTTIEHPTVRPVATGNTI